MAAFDPYSGLGKGWTGIPDWQKGSKISLSSDDGSQYRDSSDDAISSTDDEAGRGTDDDEEEEEERDDVERTPRAAGRLSKDRRKLSKGKGKGTSRQAEQSVRTTITSNTPTIKCRPRTRSISSSSSVHSTNNPNLGPAATNFSSWTNDHLQHTSTSSHSTSLSPSSLSPSFSPLSFGTPAPPAGVPRLNRQLTGNRTNGLGRTSSAPAGVFSSPPAPSSHKKKTSFAALFDSDDSDTGAANLQFEQVIQRAFEKGSGDISIENAGLTLVPSSIGDLKSWVSFDPRTRQNSPTAIRLILSSNHLTAESLSPALFTLDNLVSLSLRNNTALGQVPHAIGDLRGLKSLNLSMTGLRFLPAEILQLKLDSLMLASNRFTELERPKVLPAAHSSSAAAEGQKDTPSPAAEEQASTQQSATATTPRLCASRKHAFKVPSLVELCTRKLLEEVPCPTSSKTKSFSPSSAPSNGIVRRQFSLYKDEAISPRTDTIPLPPHLLKPFLPLVQPLPHHLRHVLSEQAASAFAQHSNAVQLCAAPGCRAPCSEFAEERIEWRYEIAGQRLADPKDHEQWIPIKWRGCSANCLDFLDE